MLDFLEKAEKIASELGAEPQNPRWPPAGGDFAPQTTKWLRSLNLRVTFEHCSNFSTSLKFQPIISYLSDG